jgi:hypothetical protein
MGKKQAKKEMHEDSDDEKIVVKPVVKKENEEKEREEKEDSDDEKIVVKPKKEKTLPCNICGTKFALIANLKRHMLTHEDKEATFVCKEDGCNAAYTSQVSLNAHVIAAHTPSANLPCTHEGCTYIGKTEALLRTHVKNKHDNVRNHECKYCDKAFHSTSHLKRHVNSVHADKVEEAANERERKTRTQPWLRDDLDASWWADINNQRMYMEFLKGELGYTNMEDWYQLTMRHFAEHYGIPLHDYYKKSIIDLLRKIFPGQVWYRFLLPVQTKIWNEHQNVKDLVDYLAGKKNYTCPEDFYGLTNEEIKDRSNLGEYVADMYEKTKVKDPHNNLYESPREFILKVRYPSYTWYPWKFDLIPLDIWDRPGIQKEFFDWVGKELGFTKYEDYYKLKYSTVKMLGGGALIKKYNSLYKTLCAVYDYKWLPWLFVHAYKDAWKDINVCRDYCSWLGNKLGITKLEDWYEVNHYALNKMRGGTILQVYGSLKNFVKMIYKDFEWEDAKFVKKGYSKESIVWLRELESLLNISLKHKLNGGEHFYKHSASKRALSVDGYYKFKTREEVIQCLEACKKAMPYLDVRPHKTSLEVVFEYHSNFWHGMYSVENNDPNSYFARDKVNPINYKTFGDMYDKSCERDKILEKQYNLIIVWNYDYFSLNDNLVIDQDESEGEDS